MQCATLTLQFAQRNSCTLRNRSRSTGISGHDRRNTHKFRSHGQLYLLGYTREAEVRLIYLEALGPHEHFYRDLKR